MTIAITREVSSRFNDCEITHIDRTPIDLELARGQHRDYVNSLLDLGIKVIELPEEPDLPDSVFVEDTAVILPEVAIITRPGADSRKFETDSITRVLAPYRRLVRITEPATLDGGDVLVLGRSIFVGLSTRSNHFAVEQIQELVGEYGYVSFGVPLRNCLHLKTAVTQVDENTVLINKGWLDTHQLRSFNWIEVDPSEPFAANCLPINNQIVFPAAFPKTGEGLERHGHKIRLVNVEELAKAEGAVTCCSLILE